jgi:hypothetical protein
MTGLIRFRNASCVMLAGVWFTASAAGVLATPETEPRVDCSIRGVAGMGISDDENTAAQDAFNNCEAWDCATKCQEDPSCEEYVFPAATGPFCDAAEFIDFVAPLYYYGSGGDCYCPYDVFPID